MKKSLKLSVVEGFFFSFMVGSFEAYILAFAVKNGFSPQEVAFLAAFPPLLGALLQLSTPLGLGRTRSLKKWVVGLGLVQILSLIGVLLLSLNLIEGHWSLFALSSIYYGAKYSMSAGWTSWMGWLVPPEMSGQFFARRSQWLQTGVLGGTLAAGLCLLTPGGFSLVFSLALVARILSIGALTQKKYDSSWDHKGIETPFNKYIQEIRKIELGKWRPANTHWVLMFTFWFFWSVHLSAPFVASFMLQNLKFGPLSYAMALGFFLVGKVLGSRVSSQVLGKFRLTQILWWSALVVAPLPGVWFFSVSYGVVLGVQFLSGLAWGVYEVALNLIFFATLDSRQKVPLITLYNFFESLAVFLGGITGMFLLSEIGGTSSSIVWLFLLGSILRVSVLLVYRNIASPALDHQQVSTPHRSKPAA